VPLFNTTCGDTPCCAIIACDEDCDSLTATVVFADEFAINREFCGLPPGTAVAAIVTGSSGYFSCIEVPSGSTQSATVMNPGGDELTVVLAWGTTCTSGVNLETGAYTFAARALATRAANTTLADAACDTVAGGECCLLIWCDSANGAGGCLGQYVTQTFDFGSAAPPLQPVRRPSPNVRPPSSGSSGPTRLTTTGIGLIVSGAVGSLVAGAILLFRYLRRKAMPARAAAPPPAQAWGPVATVVANPAAAFR